MKCNICGADNNLGSKFCENCGAIINELYVDSAKSFGTDNAEPKIDVLWNKIMAGLSSEEINDLYNSIVEYCEEYRLLCYKELKVRAYNENADIDDENHIARLYPEWVEIIGELDDRELDERICNAHEWDEAFIILCLREKRFRNNR